MRKVAHAANLDKLVENFAVLEQKIAKTQGWTNLLDIQLEETKRLLKLAQTKESCMKEECTMLHRMIEGLQSTIQNQCDVRDENEQFKKCIQVLEQKIQVAEEFNSKLVRIQSTSVKSPHQDSSALPQNIFKRKLMHLQEEKNREISALRQTIQELEQQLSGSQDNRLKRRRF
uniref:Coiled-coil domain-containing protein 152 n=1 Tax=Callorhinchus milii TaxID=7868 RepID=A0A4W3IMR5_CALMI